MVLVKKRILKLSLLFVELLDELITNKPNNIKSFSELISHVEDRPGHDRHYAIDATKIVSRLGWKPEETFESGMRKTIEWILLNREWCSSVLDGEYSGERLGRGGKV